MTRTNPHGRSVALAVMLLLALLPAAPPALAADSTFTVNTNLDAPLAPGTPAGHCQTATPSLCSLRAAVQAANATPGAHIIELPAGTYTLQIQGTDTTAASDTTGIMGDLDFTNGRTVTIRGAGAATTIIDGNGSFTHDRVIDIANGVTVTISGVTIKNGQARVGVVGHMHGGGIHNHGTLTLLDSVVSDSMSTPDPTYKFEWGGGGITNAATATLRNVVLQRNKTFGDGGTRGGGGGFENRGGATATLDRVTIADNLVEAPDVGAGIENLGTMTLTKSTVNHNWDLAQVGDGIANRKTISITDTTISDNANNGLVNTDDPFAGTPTQPVPTNPVATLRNVTISGHTGRIGVLTNASTNGTASVTMTNSTISNNGTGIDNLAVAFPSTAIVNLSGVTIAGNDVGVSNSASGFTAGIATVKVRNSVLGPNTIANCQGNELLTSVGNNLDSGNTCGLTLASDKKNVNPNLGALADNGGPTQTRALLAGSPAIDAGNGSPCLNVVNQTIEFDQRGQPRAQNSQAAGVGPCDIGAFEVASPAPPPPPPPPPGTVGATTWYFAEGFTATGFDEYLTIQNPNATAAQIAITYFLNGAPTVTKNINVPANSRYTVAVHDPAEGVGRNGGAGWQVSAKLVVTNGIGVVVERPMYFTYLGAITGGHNVLGATAPRQTWLFAEGYTGTGFDEYLTIQNPNPQLAPVKITYFLGGGQVPVIKNINVPANSRYTVTVHDAAEGVGRNQEVSAKVETTLAGGIVVERPMYYRYLGTIPGGHNVMGADAPRLTWLFPDGNTKAGVDEYLTIMNQNGVAAAVRLTYYVGGGATSEKVLSVPANSRYTVVVHEAKDGVGRGLTPAVKVESTNNVGIVVERPLYQPGGGDNVMGAPAARPTWLFAEGYTGTGFAETLVILNPNATDANVKITYFLGSGAPIEKNIVAPARSRQTVAVNGAGEGVGPNQTVSARVETTHSGGIVVERAMTFTYLGSIPGYHTVLGYAP